jgi:glycosyltransferase involved in cell wall biosynthesis
MNVVVGLPRWSLSGPCIFAQRLVQGLNSQGMDARLLLTEWSTSRVHEDQPDRLPDEGLPFDVLPAGSHDTWGVRWEALVRYLEERAPCFYLMLHDWRNNIVASRLSDRVFLIGLIQADHELDYDQAKRLGHLWNAVVTVSEPLHFTLAARFPHLAPRIATIRNAVPCLPGVPERRSDGPLRIAYSGELRRHQKRLDDMLLVAQNLADRGVDFELTLFGDGPYLSELRERACALVERGQVRFAGRCDNSTLLRELEHQQVFLLTSEYEGLSIALLEAMSRGCVPVVSNLASQSLVVQNGVNGFTSPIGDIRCFADHLFFLATNSVKRQAMSEAAFRTIIEGGYSTDYMVREYRALFERIEVMALKKRFSRPRGWISAPPLRVGEIDILPADTGEDVGYANATERWPNPPAGALGLGSVTRSSRFQCIDPVDYRVIVAIPAGQISGVDTFATHLVRGLCQRGFDARIVGSRVLDDPLGLPLADDLIVDDLGITDALSWPDRWKTMADYLESQSPCFYIPNYDYNFSGIAPRLSGRVKVISIAHGDDPVHFEHCLRIGRASDAVIGVSRAISRHLAVADPTLIPRLHTIPYGVPLPISRPGHRVRKEPTLRVAFVGRLIQLQKRAMDIIAIARLLEERGVVFELTAFGDGPDRKRMETLASDLVASGRVSFAGKVMNAEILRLLEDYDAFLLPSSFEGLSVGLLEAMSRGVIPVVSAIRSGVPELIENGSNGFIAPVGDVARFADHLEYLYRNPEDRCRMSMEAYRTVEERGYRVHDMVDRYIDLFRVVSTQPFARSPGPMAPPRHFHGRFWWIKAYLGWIRCMSEAAMRRICRPIALDRAVS